VSKVAVECHGEEHEYDGDFIVTMSPSCALVVSEFVPDVANANEGNPVQVIRHIYNKDSWTEASVDD
jgi:hypothetical protein